MQPRLAVVTRNPNAVAIRRVVPRFRLAGAYPYDARVAFRDGERANRRYGLLAPYVVPRDAAVVGAEHAAVGRADIVKVRVGVGAGDGSDASP